MPVVRPWASWVDPHHLLNKVIGAVEWPETNLTKALFDLETWMTGTVANPALTADRPPFFEVKTGPIAPLELLNKIALAHGHAYWQVRHRCAPTDPRALQLQLQSYGYEQVGGAISCRILPAGR